MTRMVGRGVLAGVIAVAGMCLGWAVPGEAAPVTFEFSGSVCASRPAIRSAAKSRWERNSRAITRSRRRRTIRTATNEADRASSSGWPYGITLNFDGGPGFHVDDYFNIHVLNGDRPSHGDRYSVQGCGGGCNNQDIGLVLLDSTLQAFSSDALPLDAPLLRLFEISMLTFRGDQNGQEFTVLGNITGLEDVRGRLRRQRSGAGSVARYPNRALCCSSLPRSHSWAAAAT